VCDDRPHLIGNLITNYRGTLPRGLGVTLRDAPAFPKAGSVLLLRSAMSYSQMQTLNSRSTVTFSDRHKRPVVLRNRLGNWGGSWGGSRQQTH